MKDVPNLLWRYAETLSSLASTALFIREPQLAELPIRTAAPRLNTLRLRQNGRHFADDSFRCTSLNENVWISITISLKFVTRGSINNTPTLFQIMAWRRPGGKPLSETMMVRLLTHICVTRPQWVKVSPKPSSKTIVCKSRSSSSWFDINIYMHILWMYSKVPSVYHQYCTMYHQYRNWTLFIQPIPYAVTSRSETVRCLYIPVWVQYTFRPALVLSRYNVLVCQYNYYTG